MQYLQALQAGLKKADKPLLERWATATQPADAPNISIDRQFSAARVRASSKVFNRVNHWQHTMLHPCFPLFLGLSQHIGVLANKQSPFPLMGMVHIRNTITQKMALTYDAMTIRCCFGAIRPHPRGVAVDIVIEVIQQNQLRQTITSTYLYRHVSDVLADTRQEPVENDVQYSADLQPVTSNVAFGPYDGLRYARISGDYNPIHLFAWSARLFGFKQAIAHGLYVLARCISMEATNRSLPADAFSITNDFIYPVPLPSSLILNSTEENIDGKPHSIHFELRNPTAARRKQIVLRGQITA